MVRHYAHLAVDHLAIYAERLSLPRTKFGTVEQDRNEVHLRDVRR